MKSTKFSVAVLIAAMMGWLSQPLVGQETDTPNPELQPIVDAVNAKLKQGHDQEKDLEENLKQFDALLAKHKGEKSEEVAQVLFMKGALYFRVNDNTAGLAVMKQVVADYPGTKSSKAASNILAGAQRQADAKKTSATLVVGAEFPPFSETDIAGKPISTAAYKGKVLLVDFWATWCGPCVAELPNVIQTYKTYHDKGFDIVGVSLDQEKEKLESFVKQKGITWQQYFDGEGWGNKLAVKYGIEAIPATFLLDRHGKIIGKELRGKELADAVAAALAQK